MKPNDLLAWHNLLFLLPMGVSVFLLGLSALSAMDNVSGNGDGADSDAGDPADGDNPDLDGDAGDLDGDADTDAEGGETDSEQNSDENNGGKATGNGVAGLLGIGKAPASLVWNVFALTFGVAGFLANRIFAPEGAATLMQILPSMGIGIVAGVVAARGAAEAAVRLMPRGATKAISRKALYGLTGRVLFTVTETGGRIRVYDEHGGMHDETCRVALGKPEIPKGTTARIVDADANGRLIVEEAVGNGR